MYLLIAYSIIYSSSSPPFFLSFMLLFIPSTGLHLLELLKFFCSACIILLFYCKNSCNISKRIYVRRSLFRDSSHVSLSGLAIAFERLLLNMSLPQTMKDANNSDYWDMCLFRLHVIPPFNITIFQLHTRFYIQIRISWLSTANSASHISR